MASPRILLVEDDEILADGLVTSLKQGGFEFQSITHGIEAERALHQHDFDAVILDLTLPGLDGTEILRRLRERHDDTPVLVLTARSTIQDRVFGLDIGADDYVPSRLTSVNLKLGYGPFSVGEIVTAMVG